MGTARQCHPADTGRPSRTGGTAVVRGRSAISHRPTRPARCRRLPAGRTPAPPTRRRRPRTSRTAGTTVTRRARGAESCRGADPAGRASGVGHIPDRRARSLPKSRWACARRRGSAAVRRACSMVRCPCGLLANSLSRCRTPGMSLLSSGVPSRGPRSVRLPVDRRSSLFRPKVRRRGAVPLAVLPARTRQRGALPGGTQPARGRALKWLKGRAGRGRGPTAPVQGGSRTQGASVPLSEGEPGVLPPAPPPDSFDT